MSDVFNANRGVAGGRVTLRTLLLVRWIAIAGQLAAVLVVQYQMGFALPLMPLLAVIGIAALVNIAGAIHRRGRRLSNRDVAAYLGFDLLQLAALLYLTGGLANPFSILMLAPVTAGAAVLTRGYVVILTVLAFGLIAVLAIDHFPLPWTDGETLSLPPLYFAGLWTALTLACGFLAAYSLSVSREARLIGDALAESQIALAREQKLSALGTLAAAVAHELGSPLSTIAVVVKELAREMPADGPQADDVRLLQSQIERCRTILAELSRRPDAGGDPFAEMALPALIETAAEPHRRAGIDLVMVVEGDSRRPPIVHRTPELMHGLGNLLQNAMQFAREQVSVTAAWTESLVSVTIEDDGPGFPPGLLGRLGEPYLSARAAEGGSHLGLGIFIAQTLLERAGATLSFDNAPDSGAVIAVTWPRAALAAAGHPGGVPAG